MRILHIINTLDPAFGGPVEAVRQFALATTGDHATEVMCLDKAAVQSNWPVPVHTTAGAVTKYCYTPALVPWLRSNAQRFDAVVVHGVWHYHTVGTWLGLRKTGVPYFVILHGMLHPWFKQNHPWKHLKKVLFWHTLVHRALRSAAAVLFLCEEERRLAPLTFRMRLQGDAVAPLGVQESPVARETSSDSTFFNSFPRLRNKRLLLFLGRICRMKACDSLLRAFSEVCSVDRDLQLVMAGPDFESWLPELMCLAAALKITDRVTWAGPLYGGLKWEALTAAELFVLPSHCETFPVAVLEALACGTPVLISDQVGIYREVQGTGAGLVCRDKAVSQLKPSALGWLLMGCVVSRIDPPPTNAFAGTSSCTRRQRGKSTLSAIFLARRRARASLRIGDTALRNRKGGSTSTVKEAVRAFFPKSPKAHAIISGPIRGAHIYTSWHDYPGAILGRTEKPLLNWFRRSVGHSETWIDIGAHYGYTAIALARLVGKRGRVFAFEPILETAACLARTRDLNGFSQLTVVPLGLDADSMLRPQRLPTVRGMADSTISHDRAEQQFFVSSFDSLWPALSEGEPVVHGIKIDVQGMELSVLRGMSQTLLRCRPVIVIEFHAGVDRKTILETLIDCGYSNTGEPIELDEERGQPRYQDNCSYAFYPRP